MSIDRKRIARAVIREWRAGEFWPTQRHEIRDGRYCPSPAAERSQLRGALADLAHQAAESLLRVVRTRLGGECPYTLVKGGTVAEFLEHCREDYRWKAAACMALRYLLRKLPPPAPEAPLRKARSLFES